MLKNIFQNFFEWDTLLHTISGFIFALGGYKIIKKFNSKRELNNLFKIIFVFCFSMTIGILWEFIEFTSDFFFLGDMQKDRNIENISSFKLNSVKILKPTKVMDIDHTILYDSFGSELIRINGYLDIGLIDTMKDLFVNLLGAIFFIFIIKVKKE